MSKPEEKSVAPGTGPAGKVPVPNFNRRGLKGFLADVRSEMKKVAWPTQKETTRLTGVVITVCVMAVVILYALSTGFGFILDRVFGTG